jgi:isopenicillin N synthase-like dioxygenase
VIDVSPLLFGGEPARQAAADQIGASSRDLGFFYAAGHAVAPAILEQLARAAHDFEARLLSVRAVIRISPEGRGLLWNNYTAAELGVVAKHAKTRPAVWVRAEIPVEDISQSARQSLRLGAEVEVLGPPALRKAVAAEARRVASLYRYRAGSLQVGCPLLPVRHIHAREDR